MQYPMTYRDARLATVVAIPLDRVLSGLTVIDARTLAIQVKELDVEITATLEEPGRVRVMLAPTATVVVAADHAGTPSDDDATREIARVALAQLVRAPGLRPRSRALAALISHIAEHRLQPGQPMPPTRAIAAREGISQGPVKAAYALLAAGGVVMAPGERQPYVVAGGSSDPCHAPSAVERIAAGVRRQIAAGELRAGDRLPTQHELAEEHHVSQPTVVVAEQELCRRGVIERTGDGAYRVSGAAGTLDANLDGGEAVLGCVAPEVAWNLVAISVEDDRTLRCRTRLPDQLIVARLGGPLAPGTVRLERLKPGTTRRLGHTSRVLPSGDRPASAHDRGVVAVVAGLALAWMTDESAGARVAQSVMDARAGGQLGPGGQVRTGGLARRLGLCNKVVGRALRDVGALGVLVPAGRGVFIDPRGPVSIWSSRSPW